MESALTTLPTDKIPFVKSRLLSALKWGGMIFVYYLVFQICYNQIAFRTVFWYDSIPDMMRGFLLNFVSIGIMFGVCYVIVMRTYQKARGPKKVIHDAFLIAIAMMAINVRYV